MENTLAQYLVEKRDASGALDVYEKGIAYSQKNLPPDPLPADRLPVSLAELRFGIFLFGRQDDGSAEEHLLRAFEQLSTNSEAAGATAARAAARLVELYIKWDRPDGAARAVKKIGSSLKLVAVPALG